VKPAVAEPVWSVGGHQGVSFVVTMAAFTSLVIPVSNNAECLEPLLLEIAAAFATLSRPYEVVFVDDASSDDSFAVIERLAGAHAEVRGLALRRECGEALALAHGLAAARGEFIVTLHGDRRDDPAEVAELLLPLEQGFDLASGWMQGRRDAFRHQARLRVLSWTTRRAAGVELHGFDYGLRACRRTVTESIPIRDESHRYLAVIAKWRGFRVTEVRVSHRRRAAGHVPGFRRGLIRGHLDLLRILFLERWGRHPQQFFGFIGAALLIAAGVVDVACVALLVAGRTGGVWTAFALGVALAVGGIVTLGMGLLGELIVRSDGADILDDADVERVVESAARAGMDAAERL